MTVIRNRRNRATNIFIVFISKMLQVPPLTSAAAVASPAGPSPSPSVAISVEPKQVIVLHTVSVKQEDLLLLQGYGRVVAYDVQVEGNMSLTTLKFDYLLLDLREKSHRLYFDSQDTSGCTVVCLCSVLEKFDAFISNLNVHSFTEFPQRTHNKIDFDALLSLPATEGPNPVCISCLNFATSYVASLKKN